MMFSWNSILYFDEKFPFYSYGIPSWEIIFRSGNGNIAIGWANVTLLYVSYGITRASIQYKDVMLPV